MKKEELKSIIDAMETLYEAVCRAVVPYVKAEDKEEFLNFILPSYFDENPPITLKGAEEKTEPEEYKAPEPVKEVKAVGISDDTLKAEIAKALKDVPAQYIKNILHSFNAQRASELDQKDRDKFIKEVRSLHAKEIAAKQKQTEVPF